LPDDFGQKRETRHGRTGKRGLIRFDRQTALEECLWIDVRDWKRRGLLVPGMGFSWSWSCRGEGTGRIYVRAGRNHVWLSYRVRRPGEDWRDVSSTISITHTPCHFGGQRVWFCCPCCGNRAQKLYMRAAYFRCRTCCDLPYASQQEAPFDRRGGNAQTPGNLRNRQLAILQERLRDMQIALAQGLGTLFDTDDREAPNAIDALMGSKSEQ